MYGMKITWSVGLLNMFAGLLKDLHEKLKGEKQKLNRTFFLPTFSLELLEYSSILRHFFVTYFVVLFP